MLAEHPGYNLPFTVYGYYSLQQDPPPELASLRRWCHQTTTNSKGLSSWDTGRSS